MADWLMRVIKSEAKHLIALAVEDEELCAESAGWLRRSWRRRRGLESRRSRLRLRQTHRGKLNLSEPKPKRESKTRSSRCGS